MREARAFGVSARRVKWRLRNLSPVELLHSFVPPTYRIDRPDFDAIARLWAERVRPEAVPPRPRPFLIIKPEGLPHEARIREALLENGLFIASEHRIGEHRRLQLSLIGLRAGTPDGPPLSACLRLEADRMRCPETHDLSKVLFLDGLDPDRTRPLKRHIRSRVGRIRFTRVVWNGVSETVFSSYVHIPDPADLAVEYAVVKEFL